MVENIIRYNKIILQTIIKYHINRRGLNDFLMLSKVILRSVSSSMEGTLSGSGLDIVKYTAHK